MVPGSTSVLTGFGMVGVGGTGVFGGSVVGTFGGSVVGTIGGSVVAGVVGVCVVSHTIPFDSGEENVAAMM